MEFIRNDCDLNVNLAGLTDNLNFKLLKFRKIPVKMTATNGFQLKGFTHHVGIDFVDIKKENGTIVRILKDKIAHIKWMKDC
ncbi:hypothetical protein SAMN05880501_10815 [Ureibacillus xyleni]|uniref:Uncharacterized protein n=1 Tax=Ureibacillus xyleni TaxID=614648 RepID=A0A285T172_9BACL|nr:hypothetical protein [Ureibacillus xyleni]SOC14983.1 hypothetical protein SAMN05880501_10815 [Ureibacillus xyleni]